MVNRFKGALVAMAAIMALGVQGVAGAADGDYLAQAKAYVAKATASSRQWTGPTTGPKAQTGKLVVFVSADQRNGGLLGVSDGAAEAAKVMGWDYRIMDGQGTVSGRASAP